jgi:hypothetical protein
MFYEIRSSHGTILAHSIASGRIEARHPSALAEEFRPVVGYIPRSHAQCCFLVSTDERPANLVMWGEPAEDRVLPFRLVRFPHDVRTALAHPLSRLHVCAGPPEGPDGVGSVVVNRPAIEGWELFELAAVSDDLTGMAAKQLASAVERVLSYGLTAPGLLAAIRAGLAAENLPAVRAIFSLLTHEESLWLAGQFLSDRPLVAKLGNLSSDDPWLHDALPALQDWLLRRRPPTAARHVLPPTLDLLDSVGQDGRYDSFGYHLTSLARRTVQPSKTLCVVTSARNEGIYLLEWIAYHRSLGVEQFFVYSNNNEDGSDALLAALADAGEIVWLKNDVAPGRRAQTKALGHAFSMLPSVLDYRWTLVIDLDEFFVIDTNRFESASDYIAWQDVQPVDVMKFSWLVFGSSAQEAWSDQPITERMSRRLPYIDAHVKSMVRSNQCIHSPPHYPVLDIRDRPVIRNGAGQIFEAGKSPAFAAHPDDSVAWINHYFLKSAEEFVWKFSRNRGDELLQNDIPGTLSDAFVAMFMAQHLSPTMVEDLRVASRAAGMRSEIVRLEVVAAFQERLARLKAALRLNADFRSDPTRDAFLACVPQ